MTAGTNNMKWSGFFVIAGIIAAGLSSRGIHAQSGQTPAVAEVRKTLDTARKEIESYKTAGGAAGAADHPALKWDAALWAYRARYPRSEAAALASAEAVRLLVRAELWDRAHARPRLEVGSWLLGFDRLSFSAACKIADQSILAIAATFCSAPAATGLEDLARASCGIHSPWGTGGSHDGRARGFIDGSALRRAGIRSKSTGAA